MIVHAYWFKRHSAKQDATQRGSGGGVGGGGVKMGQGHQYLLSCFDEYSHLLVQET